ncbi:MAG: FxLYD domain-containing protein [Candidatus Binatia bacterium]
MARRQNIRRQRTLLWLGVAVVFLSYFFWALQAEEVFRVVTKKLEQTEAGVVVSGEVHNTTATPSAVNVEVTLFDEQGRKLSEETVALSPIDAGGTAVFRTQPKRLTAVKDYTIYVNTGRNMYGN